MNKQIDLPLGPNGKVEKINRSVNGYNLRI